MTNTCLAGLTAALLSTAVFAAPPATQDPTQTPAQRPGTRPSSATTVRPTLTLAGCLYKEAQVPGRTPNVVERAGILEDYILADAVIPPGGSQPGATPGATGTSGTMPASGNMYKVEKISHEELKAMVGKRVEVTGQIDPEGNAIGGRPGSGSGAPTADRGLGPDKINLPEFEASSIREIPGTCPATPAARK